MIKAIVLLISQKPSLTQLQNHMKEKSFTIPKSPVACIILSSFLVTSCCSIFNGSKQSIGFSSSPDGANVSIDGIPRGKTPLTLKLERDEDHTVKIALPGYYPYSATLTHSVSGWVWGNLLFGGLIGLAVDAGTGSLYVLTPEQVQAQLVPGRHMASTQIDQKNQAYLFVVLKPEQGWTKIDNLRKI